MQRPLDGIEDRVDGGGRRDDGRQEHERDEITHRLDSALPPRLPGEPPSEDEGKADEASQGTRQHADPHAGASDEHGRGGERDQRRLPTAGQRDEGPGEDQGDQFGLCGQPMQQGLPGPVGTQQQAAHALTR